MMKAYIRLSTEDGLEFPGLCNAVNEMKVQIESLYTVISRFGQAIAGDDEIRYNPIEDSPQYKK